MLKRELPFHLHKIVIPVFLSFCAITVPSHKFFDPPMKLQVLKECVTSKVSKISNPRFQQSGLPCTRRNGQADKILAPVGFLPIFVRTVPACYSNPDAISVQKIRPQFSKPAFKPDKAWNGCRHR